MEIGTYITDIDAQTHNREHSHPKFTRFNTQTHKSLHPSETLKKVNKFNYIFSKNINVFLPDQYYDLKKAKPGIAFYRTILQADQRRKTEPFLPQLRINIPQTILLQQNTPQLIYTQDGVVKVKAETNINEYLEFLRQKQAGKIYPAALQGVSNGNFIDFNIFLSTQIGNRVLPKNENQISLKYTSPYGDYPNTLRLFYIPKRSRNYKPNFGFKAINKNKIDNDLITKKYKQIHNYVVDFNRQQHIIVTPVKGKALENVQKMSQSIIDFIEAVKGVRVSQIVVDYIFGVDKQYYFHQIKLIRSTSLSNIWDIGSFEQKQEKYKQQTNQIICKLCAFSYPKKQISKLVTNKLIGELLVHLSHRGQNHFHNSIKGSNMSISSHVCDLCYQLIVAEHHLIDLQRQFNSLMNVKTNQVIRVKDLNTSQIVTQSMQLNKWRLFLYIQKIKNLSFGNVESYSNFQLTIKFNSLNQTINKQCELQEVYKSSLRPLSATILKRRQTRQQMCYSNSSKRHSKKATMNTNCTNRSDDLFQRSINIDFQKIKLITFFTKNQNIQQFFNKQQLQFQLTFQNCNYKGNSATLKNFTNSQDCQRHSCQILLFNQKYQYCSMELNIGLICDGQTKICANEIVSSYHQHLYFSNQNQSCTPLPEQWIEIISQGAKLKEANEYQQTQSNLQKHNNKKLVKTNSLKFVRKIENVKTLSSGRELLGMWPKIAESKQQYQQYL